VSPEQRAKISERMKGNHNGRGVGTLTDDQVQEIRRRYAAGEATITQLAELFKCRAIYRVLIGISYPHVPGALSPDQVHAIGCRNRSSGTRRWWYA
jgi:hypothetical protein